MTTWHRFGEFPSISTEYVQVQVDAISRGRRVNLSALGVQFAYTTETAEPGVGDWVPGTWENLNGTYLAQWLIGPGGTPIPEGDWLVWIRVVSNPEQPIRPVGLVRIT